VSALHPEQDRSHLLSITLLGNAVRGRNTSSKILALPVVRLDRLRIKVEGAL
jgi:hypothetical protein